MLNFFEAAILPWSNKFDIQKFFEIDKANPYISQNNCHKQQDAAPSPLGEGWGEASDWLSNFCRKCHLNNTCQWQRGV